MKPTNVIQVPAAFWALRDDRGEFYVYSTADSGVRCTADIRLARKYSTRKGAWAAQGNLIQAYGKFTTPIQFTTKLTYHATENLPI